MFFQLFNELALQPYAASFFYSYVNQEYLDDQIPVLTFLRKALMNIKKFDFAMLHGEIKHFETLKDEIDKKWPN